MRNVSGPCRCERGVRRRQPRDGNAIRRTRDVVHAEGMAEPDRARLSAMLAAAADLQRVADTTSRGDRELDEFAHAFFIEHLKRIVSQDAELEIIRQEATRVVAAQPERRLGEIVGAEREELGSPGYLIRRESRSWQLD